MNEFSIERITLLSLRAKASSGYANTHNIAEKETIDLTDKCLELVDCKNQRMSELEKMLKSPGEYDRDALLAKTHEYMNAEKASTKHLADLAKHLRSMRP